LPATARRWQPRPRAPPADTGFGYTSGRRPGTGRVVCSDLGRAQPTAGRRGHGPRQRGPPASLRRLRAEGATGDAAPGAENGNGQGDGVRAAASNVPEGSGLVGQDSPQPARRPSPEAGRRSGWCEEGRGKPVGLARKATTGGPPDAELGAQAGWAAGHQERPPGQGWRASMGSEGAMARVLMPPFFPVGEVSTRRECHGPSQVSRDSLLTEGHRDIS